MKYIRTKDKIMCCEHTLSQEEIDLYASNRTPLPYPFETIKQADTIEELCDAYVIVPKDKKYKPFIENTLSGFDDFEDVLKHNDIYLSIWVGALLKPVAKLNDKGDSELL